MEQSIGRYRILEEIASGGQGTVYRAYDPESGQIIAVKVLHPTLSGDRAYTERFRREASLAASIDHPNVVKIFEVGQDDDRFFMALEFLPESLARVIESGGQMRIAGAAQFAVQIAEGLAAAHALGIVHRDVKPQNVLVGADGTAKVTDFGIARAESLNTMTATGVVMGTPHYMSPEQARGERADARSDVYSLGCMLYHMLAGNVPFKGDTPLAVIRQQIEEQPKRLREVRRDVPRRLEAVVDRAMAKDPRRRYQTTAEMGQALRDAVPDAATPPRAARSSVAPPPKPVEQPARTPQRPSTIWMSAWAKAWQRSHRRRWAWVGTLLTVALALTVTAVRLDAYDRAREYVEEAGWVGAVAAKEAVKTVEVEKPVEVVVEKEAVKIVEVEKLVEVVKEVPVEVVVEKEVVRIVEVEKPVEVVKEVPVEVVVEKEVVKIVEVEKLVEVVVEKTVASPVSGRIAFNPNPVGNPIDTRIGPLRDNGGPTMPHALLSGSPAIDAGDDSAAPTTDQRGVDRPHGESSDIGAFESGPSTPTAPSGGLEPISLFEDFATLVSSLNWVFVGSARQDSARGGVVLTEAVNDQLGYLFSTQPINTRRFKAGFSFEIGGGTGADGLALVLSRNIPTRRDAEAPGGDGGGHFGGPFLDGFAIEFDTHGGNQGDPSYNHVGVTTFPRYRALVAEHLGHNLNNNGVFFATIVFEEGHVELYLENTDIGLQTTKALDYTIPGFVPFDGYVGFVGATGALNDAHLIYDFAFDGLTASVAPTAELYVPSASTPAVSGLVAYWPGEGNANDGAGGHHGMLEGGATIAPGIVGQAFNFDGDNDFISTPLDIDQSASSPGVTFEAWVYPTSISGGRHHVISSDDSGYDWSILREGGTWFVFTGESSRSTGFSVDLNQWQHVAAAFSPAEGVVRFYKNWQAVTIPFIDFDTSDSKVAIGRNPSYPEFFSGIIDEVEIYDRALNDSEIKGIYEGSRATAPRDAIVYVANVDGTRHIFRMNPDGSGVTQITFGESQDLYPTWSPDRSRIAFMRQTAPEGEGRWGDIWVISADGTGLRRLTHGGDFHAPDWSPSGDEIIVDGRGSGIQTLHVASGKVTTVLGDGLADRPDWSPDGSQIAFHRPGEPSELFVMNADGSKIRSLGKGLSPDWSPDGKRILFNYNSDGKWDVYLINVDGTGFANLTAGRPGDYVLPDWSPGGDRIVLSFRDHKDGDWEIGVMDATGGPITNLTNSPAHEFLGQW